MPIRTSQREKHTACWRSPRHEASSRPLSMESWTALPPPGYDDIQETNQGSLSNLLCTELYWSFITKAWVIELLAGQKNSIFSPLPSMKVGLISQGLKAQPSNHRIGLSGWPAPWHHLISTRCLGATTSHLAGSPPWVTKTLLSLRATPRFRGFLPEMVDKGQSNYLLCTPILAWEIPWTEEPGRLQSWGSQWIRHDWAHTLAYQENSPLNVNNSASCKGF